MIQYCNLIGKTREEILDLLKNREFNDRYSDEWIVCLGRNYLGRKRFLYLFFENNIIKGYCTVTKNLWNK
ncbi:hypothetical protein [Chryseobacterium viscerum]|uniref:Uncharacterized protein n=1 Tax=Chryseobacterium viscerum TaxID=1037377 RepID=A0A316WHV1_9FLAO|nr:hypothetical protein [Chryseobacterium viscerum]PWN58050.1 hypothetical protein C1634_024790 [Chryseobacterium viscerum]